LLPSTSTTQLGIATHRLVEGVLDDALGRVLDACPHPLVDRPRPTLLLVLPVVDAVQYVADGPRPRVDRVHGRHLGHSLAVGLLALGQPRLQPTRRRLGLLARRLAQIAMQRRDALGVEAQDQELLGVLGLAQPAPVELVEVASSADRQLLGLALRDLCPALLLDQLDDLVERRPGGLLGDDTTHFERVLLFGQLHRGVQRCQRLRPLCLVQLAVERHLAELRHHRASTLADPDALDAVGVADGDLALLRGAAIEVRLHHLAHQLATGRAHHPLDFVQRRVHRLVADQVVLELLHAPPRFAERAVVGDPDRRVHRHQAVHATRNRSIRIVPRRQLPGIDQVCVAEEDPHPKAFTKPRRAGSVGAARWPLRPTSVAELRRERLRGCRPDHPTRTGSTRACARSQAACVG
jgi:hypothetical protein